MTVMLWVLLAIHLVVPMPVMEIVDRVSGWVFFASFVLPTFALGFIIGYAMIGRPREAAARVPGQRPDPRQTLCSPPPPEPLAGRDGLAPS